jgi:hypothetical protein
VLDFVHRMETKDGATVSLRQAGLTLASISGFGVDGSERRQEPRRASTTKETAFLHRLEAKTALLAGQSANARPFRRATSLWAFG